MLITDLVEEICLYIAFVIHGTRLPVNCVSNSLPYSINYTGCQVPVT